MENALAELDPASYWNFLRQYAALLEELISSFEEGKTKEKSSTYRLLAQARIMERSFNNCIDNFMRVLEAHGRPPVTVFLRELLGETGGTQWNELKQRRDRVADRISTLIESDPHAMQEYLRYCESLKKLRSIGAVL